MDGISEEKIKWFKEQNFEVQLYPEKTVKKFRDPEDLMDFLNSELSYWESFDLIRNSFRSPLSSLKEAFACADTSTSNWRSQFQNAVNTLTKAEQSNLNTNSWMLFSATRLGKKVHAVVDEYGSVGGEFFLYYYFNRGGRIERKEHFVGAVEGYLFSEQGKHLKKNVSKNAEAFDELYSRLDSYFDGCIQDATDRHSEFEAIKTEIVAWKSKEESAVKTQREEFQIAHEGRGQQHNEEFVQSMKDWKQKLSDLEDLYESKLQLEEPVKYWDQLRESHSRWGIGFSVCTALVGILLICIFYNILYTWPPQWLEGNKWDLNTVKGTILLLTMTSVGLYLISLGAKFSVSSFHLARDAQERRQLTYIYLSLIQKGAIKPEEQKIVLQALFSRADTGLLKGDHGPTMPGAELLGKIKG
ncbi:DUF6161 domain-containing protein [Coraliomargarita sp. SDUM461003]|uniref:DUF6161 domain-containing protein n=1 Tax=Thalassobacterium maritimum TaxID=3041265 RepID=A0ABU1ASF6_9BACT|nr:DUF6161 domain-containing protein [Coraliomargarita sp. SDUM461003]MDQ8206184.1 DUF6161 domain-containing protein [Coraliomargarita sp. SDUM461003]